MIKISHLFARKAEQATKTTHTDTENAHRPSLHTNIETLTRCIVPTVYCAAVPLRNCSYSYHSMYGRLDERGTVDHCELLGSMVHLSSNHHASSLVLQMFASLDCGATRRRRRLNDYTSCMYGQLTPGRAGRGR